MCSFGELPTEYSKESVSTRWLSGGRALYVDDHRIHLLDVETRTHRVVHAVEPPDTIDTFTISPDERTLYYSRHGPEADVWLLEAK